jgi:hypothetical protein
MPKAVLTSLIDRLDPLDRKLVRSIRAALTKRFPTANQLAYDYGSRFVIAYSPTDRGIDSLVSIVAGDKGVDRATTPLPSRGKGAFIIRPTAASKRSVRKTKK